MLPPKCLSQQSPPHEKRHFDYVLMRSFVDMTLKLLELEDLASVSALVGTGSWHEKNVPEYIFSVVW